MNINMHESLTAENLTPSVCSSVLQDAWAGHDDTESHGFFIWDDGFLAIAVFLPLVAQKSRIVAS